MLSTLRIGFGLMALCVTSLVYATDGACEVGAVSPSAPLEFEVINEREWARVSFQADETGVWQPVFRLHATREPC